MSVTSSLGNFSLSEWLHDPPYKNGTIAEELKCYGLPYGGIGFASHLITYYTIFCLAQQRSPWRPWKKNEHKWIDAILAAFGLLATIILTVLTIIRCRNRWQFIAMATWKMVLSISFGVLSFHAAMLVDRNKNKGYEGVVGGGGYVYEPYSAGVYGSVQAVKNKDYKKVLWWLLLYIPGVFAGLAGLLNLVIQEIGHNAHVKTISIVFGSAIGFTTGMMLLFGIIGTCKNRKVKEVTNGSKESLVEDGLGLVIMSFMVATVATSILSALYSDWVLGAIANNLVGLPSGDVAPLYWGYIIAKRLPFFSF